MSFISHFNVAFSHWVFSLGAENVTTANTSGPTGEGLVFLTAVDSSAKFPCPWQGDWYVTLFWAPIKGVEAWCLPEEDLTVLIAIRLMRSFRVILCIDFFFFFSPHHHSLLWMFFLSTGASPIFLQIQQGRFHYLIVPCSTNEQRGHFSLNVPDHNLSCQVSVLCPVQGSHIPLWPLNKTVPQFPLPYYVLWCHIEVSAVPSRAVIDIHLYRCYQWYMYAVSQQPLFF